MSEKVLISHVQRFSVHDGPGIRTTVFFKGCPLRCRWCQNPETLRATAELAFHADRCREHGACGPACPRGALRPGAPGRVDRQLCDACGKCVPACPYGALEIIGRRAEIAELMDEVLRDLPFFRSSGGGVTLSGGEPMSQPESVLAAARACCERGVSVGLQTCGACRWERLGEVLPLLAFLHFDLKAIEPARHRELTGLDNGLLLANARALCAASAPVTFRTPIVPGLNDGDDDLARLAAFLHEVGRPALHLLRYHDLGEAKLARLGHPRPPLGALGDSAAALAAAAARLRSQGIEVTT